MINQKKIIALLMVTSILLSVPATTLAYSSSSYSTSSSSQITTKYTGMITSNKLNVRSKNSTSGKLLGSLNKNNSVEINKKMSNGWYEIIFNNSIGYICGKYVKITSSNVPPYALKSSDKVIGTAIIISNSLTVRRGRSVDSPKVGSLKKDSAVGIIAKYSNGWYKVFYGEGYGFINGKYTLSISDTSSNAQKEYLRIQDILKKNSNNITKLVNRNNALKSGYKPSDLVKPSVSATKTLYLRKTAAKSLETMFKDAKKDRIYLCAVSGFRSSSYQTNLYKNSLKANGFAFTNKYIAKPNHSEHQTGLAIDLSSKSVGYDLVNRFENTKEGKWLARNAHKYGFILRYNKDRVKDTGYSFEPWHFRYVGKDVATYIYKNNLILEDLYK